MQAIITTHCKSKGPEVASRVEAKGRKTVSLSALPREEALWARRAYQCDCSLCNDVGETFFLHESGTLKRALIKIAKIYETLNNNEKAIYNV